jgi:hypothetical protein
MRIRHLGSRPAPAALLDLLSRTPQGRGPATPVARRVLPYWQEHGWQRSGNTYSGSYQSRYGAFQGWIEERAAGHIDFYLHAPSPEIQRHSHWVCFQPRNDGWYLVHMSRVPHDVSSGIITIERLVTEAYER